MRTGRTRSSRASVPCDTPPLVAAQLGPVTTASGMVLNGRLDTVEQAPAVEEGDIGTVEQRTALVDFLEFYLFNYVKAGTGSRRHRHDPGGSCWS